MTFNESRLLSMRVSAIKECKVPVRYQTKAGKAWRLAWSALEDERYQGRNIRKHKREVRREIKARVCQSMGLGFFAWLVQPLLMAVVNRIVAFVFNQWLETEDIH